MTAVSPLLEIFEERPWQHALFLTYAFSLTFFESAVFPRLRAQNCERITVIADVEGYSSSTQERGARFAGIDYELWPVANRRGGIFHPKCIYLSSAEGDVLVIGSGNLTFGGYGRNLEVFEILTPDKDGTAFVDFAEFLQTLSTSPTVVKIPKEAKLETFIRLARRAGKGGAPGHARLISSLSASVHSQLVELVKREVKSPSELFVLSPFHDKDGYSVIALADALGIKNLVIGVPKGAKTFCFPFARVAGKSRKLRAREPIGADTKRQLHAKWFEIAKGRTRAIFTGSINATRPALNEAVNVEIGVFRVTVGPSPTQWKEIDVPHFSPTAQLDGDKKHAHVLLAVLSEPYIEGQIFGPQTVKGSWAGVLEGAGVYQEIADIEVEQDGSFKCSVPPNVGGLDTEALQLTAEKGEMRAVGWVNQPHQLSMPTGARRALSNIRQFLSGDETANDFEELLRYIVDEVQPEGFAASELQAQVPAATKEHSEKTVAAPNVTVSLAAVKNAAQSGVAAFQRFVEAHRSKHRDAAISALSELLVLGSSKAEGQAKSIDDEEEEEDIEEKNFKRAKPKTHREFASDKKLEALTEFNDTLQHIYADIKRPALLRAHALAILCAVNLRYRIRRGQFDVLRTFLGEWIRAAASLTRTAEVRGFIEWLFFPVIAYLSAYAPDTENAGTQTMFDLSRPTLREWLDQFSGEQPQADNARAHIARFFETDLGMALAAKDGKEMIANFDGLIARPRRATVLAALLGNTSDQRILEKAADLFNGTEIALLQSVIRGHRVPLEIKQMPVSACPKDYVRIDEDGQAVLRTSRLLCCPTGRHLLLWVR